MEDGPCFSALLGEGRAAPAGLSTCRLSWHRLATADGRTLPWVQAAGGHGPQFHAVGYGGQHWQQLSGVCKRRLLCQVKGHFPMPGLCHGHLPPAGGAAAPPGAPCCLLQPAHCWPRASVLPLQAAGEVRDLGAQGHQGRDSSSSLPCTGPLGPWGSGEWPASARVTPGQGRQLRLACPSDTPHLYTPGRRGGVELWAQQHPGARRPDCTWAGAVHSQV